MRILKVGAVVFGALVITTLGISASDMLQGNSGSLLGQLSGGKEAGPCPAGMIHVPTAATFTCVDEYEVVPSAACPHSAPSSPVQTQENLNALDCVAESAPDKHPWTFIAREQARALCARSEKRLPTMAEWYTIALATPDDAALCHLASSSVVPARADTQCRSGVGVANAIGNVWEWVSDDVIDGAINGVALPAEGYVSQVTGTGQPVVTSNKAEEQFNDDYLWTTADGVFGILRGGYFASKSDGGVYSMQAETAPTLATAAIGFRCVK